MPAVDFSCWNAPVTGFTHINRTNSNKPNAGELEIELSTAYYTGMTTPECQKRMLGIRDLISKKQMCVMSTPWDNNFIDTFCSLPGVAAFRNIDLFELRILRSENLNEIEKENAYFENMMKSNGNVEPVRAVLEGVNSFDYGCRSKTPAVYTKVSEYMDWIKQYTVGMYTATDELI